MDLICFYSTTKPFGCFSNWYKSYFNLSIRNPIMSNFRWSCVEQYMMAKKAFIFSDKNTFYQICLEHNPAIIKSLGRQIRNYNEKIWSSYREAFVFEACYAKFTQNVDIQNILLSTGDSLLVEASPSDDIWGAGMHENYLMDYWKRNQCLPNNIGLNLLGKCLMNVRELLNGKK